MTFFTAPIKNWQCDNFDYKICLFILTFTKLAFKTSQVRSLELLGEYILNTLISLSSDSKKFIQIGPCFHYINHVEDLVTFHVIQLNPSNPIGRFTCFWHISPY